MVHRQLKRRQVIAFFQKLEPCLVGVEACSSSHHWARELISLGHDVRLTPPAYLKPYVKRHNNDAKDAEAICEEVHDSRTPFMILDRCRRFGRSLDGDKVLTCSACRF